MIFDRALVAAGDEHHVPDTGRHRLLDRVLDERLVDDRHHLLGTRLGRREKSAAHSGDRENRFGNFFHASDSLNIFRSPSSSTTATPSLWAFSSLPPASAPA